jgi:hypothetical protein
MWTGRLPSETMAVDGTDESDDAERQGETKALSDADIHDALPDDLDASASVGPYLFPNNNRRRLPAVIYTVIALACLAAWFATRNQSPVLINGGYVAAAIGLLLVAAYSFAAGWDLKVDEREALVVATRRAGFPVGHASAQMGWRGLLSRPTWRILLYSAEEPPQQRGLVLIDGVDAEVIEWFVEPNPEDWTALT